MILCYHRNLLTIEKFPVHIPGRKGSFYGIPYYQNQFDSRKIGSKLFGNLFMVNVIWGCFKISLSHYRSTNKMFSIPLNRVAMMYQSIKIMNFFWKGPSQVRVLVQIMVQRS